MALLSLPVDLPLTVHLGIGAYRQFVWKPDGVTGQDFTGWSALLLIGPRCGTALLELTSGTGGDITLGTDGTITVLVPADVVLPIGELHYQLDLTPPPPTPAIRFLTGRVSVVCAITPAAP